MKKNKLKYQDTEHYYWDWVPIYERYEKVEKFNSCEECGQDTDSYYEEVGVNLIRYDRKRFKKGALYGFAPVLKTHIMPLIEQSITSNSRLFEMLKGR